MSDYRYVTGQTPRPEAAEWLRSQRQNQRPWTKTDVIIATIWDGSIAVAGFVFFLFVLASL